MARYFLSFAFIAVITIFGAAAANAQSRSIKADIPFDFVAGTSQLQAGEYSLQRGISGSGDSVLRLVSLETGESYYLSAVPERAVRSGDSILKFNRYGDRHFLSGVVVPESDFAASFKKGQAERRVASGNSDRRATVSVRTK